MVKGTPKKKIFVFRFNSTMLIEVIKNLQGSEAEVVYWEGSKKYFDLFIDTEAKKLFPGTVFHNTIQAVQGISAPDIDTSEFIPPGEKLLQALSEYESQIIVMMSAVDTHNTPYSKKKYLYYKYLSYWNGVLSTSKPDAIIFGDIPHIAHQYTLYCLAKHLGIKVIMLRTIPVLGRLIFFQDHTVYKRLQNELKKIKDKNYTLNDLDNKVKSYYLIQANSEKAATPFYMKKGYREGFTKQSKFLPINRVIVNLRKGTIFKTSIGYIKMLSIEREIASLEGFKQSGYVMKKYNRDWNRKKLEFKKEHKQYVQKPDLSKKFIYVALHKQPEASTSAMGGVFNNQILMIETLAKSIPDDWFLYVKENPLQWEGPRAERGRYPGYYENIIKNKNVVLIPTNADTYELIQKSQAVATITGTVGWEAILRKRPALVFGHIWYSFAEGAYRVIDVPSCRKAIGEIIDGSGPNEQSNINFLVALIKSTIQGFPNKRFQKDSGLTVEENIKNITGEYIKELNT
tara:strand:+ start:1243 stop:2784 length:1542 start_codon:yes stop_codon:yes gene_type:complete